MIDRSIGPDISGMIFETLLDEALLKDVADFMWTFGRQPLAAMH
jgi:hypothetical protein